MKKLPIMFWVGCAALLLVSAGCGAKEESQAVDPKKDDETRTRLRGLVQVYHGYLASNPRNRNLEDFKSFVKKMRSQELRAFRIEKPDDLFVSPRDGQPFQINFNIDPQVKVGAGSGKQPPFVAHEQKGVNGLRMAVLMEMSVVEVGEEQFKP